MNAEEHALSLVRKYGKKESRHQILKAYEEQITERRLTDKVLTLHDALGQFHPYCELVVQTLNADLARAVTEYAPYLSPSMLVSTIRIATEKEWDMVTNLRERYCGLTWIKKLPKQHEFQVRHGNKSWKFEANFVSTRFKATKCFERQEERLLWISVFFALARRDPIVWLRHAPVQLVCAAASLPLIN